MVTTLLNRPSARDAGYEMAQYICKRLVAAGAAAATVSIGVVPAGAIITNVYSKVVTAIAGGTTPALTVGSNATAYDNLVAAMAETAGSEDLMPLTTITMPLAVDTEFFANISGGATAGDAYVAIQFIKPLA